MKLLCMPKWLRTIYDWRLPRVLLLVALPGATNAQFEYTVDNGSVSVTAYTGADVDVIVPNTIEGLPVASIGPSAFLMRTNLIRVTLPEGVTNIGSYAFSGCTGLTNVTIPDSVVELGRQAFEGCAGLTRVTIPSGVTWIRDFTFAGCAGLTNITISEGVTDIGRWAFENCTGLISVTIPSSVTCIGSWGFSNCTNLVGVYFQGDAPVSLRGFFGYTPTIYHLPGTAGWNASFDSCPTVLWDPRVETSGDSSGLRTNPFGFKITASSELVILVEACTNLANANWIVVGTNRVAQGSSSFDDLDSSNHPDRFYRLRSP